MKSKNVKAFLNNLYGKGVSLTQTEMLIEFERFLKSTSYSEPELDIAILNFIDSLGFNTANEGIIRVAKKFKEEIKSVIDKENIDPMQDELDYLKQMNIPDINLTGNDGKKSIKLSEMMATWKWMHQDEPVVTAALKPLSKITTDEVQKLYLKMSGKTSETIMSVEKPYSLFIINHTSWCVDFDTNTGLFSIHDDWNHCVISYNMGKLIREINELGYEFPQKYEK